eukprot:2868307-Alexandrium_andersonii.AAC.1
MLHTSVQGSCMNAQACGAHSIACVRFVINQELLMLGGVSLPRASPHTDVMRFIVQGPERSTSVVERVSAYVLLQ